MSSFLANEITKLLQPELCLEETYSQFLDFIKIDKLLRENNARRHCCVFFIPFNPKTKEIFIVRHKKADQWIFPGGHIEENETLEDTVKREAKEELGLSTIIISKPFVFSIIDISKKKLPCQLHYDIWHLIPTQKKIHADLREFYDTQWTTVDNAKLLVTYQPYMKVLERIRKII